MADVTQWAAIVDACVRRYASKLDAEAKLDLRQDLFVVILQTGANSRIDVLDVCRKKIAEVRGAPIDGGSWEDPSMSNEIESNGGEKRAEEVRAAIGVLPSVEQAVVRAHYYDNLTDAETAVQLGRSIKWVKTTKALALKKIENILRGEKK